MNKMTFSEVMQSAEIITSLHRNEGNRAPNGGPGLPVQPVRHADRRLKSICLSHEICALVVSVHVGAAGPIPLCSRKADDSGNSGRYRCVLDKRRRNCVRPAWAIHHWASLAEG